MRFLCKNKKCQYEFNFYTNGPPNNKMPSSCPLCDELNPNQITIDFTQQRLSNIKTSDSRKRCRKISF